MSPQTGSRINYRIHTELKPNLGELAWRRGFSCLAITAVEGYWQGVKELGAVVSIIGRDADRGAVLQLARDIKCFNGQEAVYVTETAVVLHDVR